MGKWTIVQLCFRELGKKDTDFSSGFLEHINQQDELYLKNNSLNMCVHMYTKEDMPNTEIKKDSNAPIAFGLSGEGLDNCFHFLSCYGTVF